MSAFHDQFKKKVSHGVTEYTWETNRPVFAAARTRYYLPPEGELEDLSSEAETEPLEVCATCEHGNGFGDYQEKAWQFILENGESIEHEIRRKFLATLPPALEYLHELSDEEDWVEFDARMKE